MSQLSNIIAATVPVLILVSIICYAAYSWRKKRASE